MQTDVQSMNKSMNRF